MHYILGIKFRDYGQIHFFSAPENSDVPAFAAPAGDDRHSPPGLRDGEARAQEALDSSLRSQILAKCSIRVGDIVIAETGQGPGFGTVVHVGSVVPSGMDAQEVKPILRAATDKDQGSIADNRRLADEAMRYCAARIRSRALDMKLVDVEVLFDKSKFIFYFTAPTRIDFRELVKDLVREYHVRIELRQIGVRHETQMIGAVGSCGMVCCCRRFLRRFAPVTIKMAKEQNLFLNPAKISGICGRLLCCLSYEQDNYDAFHRECPRLGKRYQTRLGGMKILRANMFRNSVVALNENSEEVELTLDEWRATDPRRPDGLSIQPGHSPDEKTLRPADGELMIVAVDSDYLDSMDEEEFADEDAGIDTFFALAPEDGDERLAGGLDAVGAGSRAEPEGVPDARFRNQHKRQRWSRT